MSRINLPEPPDGSNVIVEYLGRVKVAFWRADGTFSGHSDPQWFQAEYGDAKWSDPMSWQEVLENAVALYSASAKPLAQVEPTTNEGVS